MSAVEHAEHGPGGHRRTGPHRRAHRLVGGAQPVVVLDRDHPAAADRPGEDHDAGPRREHRLPDRSGQIGAAVPAAVRVGGRPERDQHGRRRVQRPAVAGARSRRSAGAVRPTGRDRLDRRRAPTGRVGSTGVAARPLPADTSTATTAITTSGRSRATRRTGAAPHAERSAVRCRVRCSVMPSACGDPARRGPRAGRLWMVAVAWGQLGAPAERPAGHGVHLACAPSTPGVTSRARVPSGSGSSGSPPPERWTGGPA